MVHNKSKFFARENVVGFEHCSFGVGYLPVMVFINYKDLTS
jgi:hypothetical protein